MVSLNTSGSSIRNWSTMVVLLAREGDSMNDERSDRDKSTRSADMRVAKPAAVAAADADEDQPVGTFVPGEPISFYVGRDEAHRTREQSWARSVATAVGSPIKRPRLDFVVSSLKRGYNDFDLDNLAKPLLDAIGAQ